MFIVDISFLAYKINNLAPQSARFANQICVFPIRDVYYMMITQTAACAIPNGIEV